MTSEQQFLAYLSTIAQVNAGIVGLIFAGLFLSLPSFGTRKDAVKLEIVKIFNFHSPKPERERLWRHLRTSNGDALVATLESNHQLLPEPEWRKVNDLISQLEEIWKLQKKFASVALQLFATLFLPIALALVLMLVSQKPEDFLVTSEIVIGVVTLGAWVFAGIVLWALFRSGP